MNRKWIVSLTLVSLIVLSACAPVAAPASSDGLTAQHSLTVTGSGIAFGAPDMVIIQIGVQSRGADPAAAVAENSAKMQRLMDALAGLGVDAKDIQTSNFSVNGQQQVDPQGQLTGETQYVVDNTVSLTLRDPQKLGQALGQAVAAGANNIYGVNYTMSDPNSLSAQARDLAMADAKARAEQLAKAAGVTLGTPTNISEYTSGPIPYAGEALYGKGGGAASTVPMAAGQFQLTLQVTVSYQIP